MRMRITQAVLTLALGWLITYPAVAASKNDAGKSTSVRYVSERIDKMVEGLDLTAAQKASLDTVKADLAPLFAEAATKLDVLTPEQTKARSSAGKAARAAGKTALQIREAVNDATQISDAEMTQLNDARKQMKALNHSLGEKVLAVLTPKQKELQAAQVNAATQKAMKVSTEGFAAMRAVRAARIAIFNGQPNVAVETLDKAKEDLDAAARDESMCVSNIKTMAGDKAAQDTTGSTASEATTWIPIDGQITLADAYVPTPEKKEHADRANEHFKNGRAKEAIEELRLGDINVTYTRLMLPLSATKRCIADAIKLAKEQKYYEANMALKGAEDGLIYDSVSLTDTLQYKSAPNAVAKKASASETKLK